MAINLGSAYGKVSLDTTGLTTGVANGKAALGQLQMAGTALGAGLATVGAGMTAAITIPLMNMANSSVKAASDYTEALNKVKVVFGGNSQAVQDWSKNAATSMGLSQRAALEAAGTYGNLFSSMGLGADETQKMSMSLVELASDLASFNNIDPNVALDKLMSGMTGMSKPMKELGVDVSAAAVEAKAAEMGFQKLNGEFTEGAKIQARYALIMEQTKNSQGDFLRTSDELANSQRTQNALYEDSLRILGENLKPLIIMLTQLFNSLLQKFNSAPPIVQKMIFGLLALAALAGPLMGFAGSVIFIIFQLQMMGISITGIGTTLLGILPAIMSFGGMLWAALLPLLPVLALIAASVLLIYLLWSNWSQLSTTVWQLGQIVKISFQNMANDAKSAFTQIQNDSGKMGVTIGQKIAGLIVSLLQKWNSFKASVSQIFNYVAQAWNSAMTSVVTTAYSVYTSVAGAFNNIGVAIQNLIGYVQQLAASLLNIVLPDNLTPGSPTPFENGLAGIRNQMEIMSRSSIPNFANSLNGSALAGAMAKSAPVSSNSGGNTFNLASGLTLHDVNRFMDEKINRFAGRLAEQL